jgi:multidrug efflux pump subunit AcrA (membrane-fusion protein)
MKNVTIRRFGTVIGAVLVLGVPLGIKKYIASLKEAPKTETSVDQNPLVKSMVIDSEEAISQIEISGRAIAKNKVDVYAEVSGRLVNGNKQFKDGISFKKGEVLLKLNASDIRMNLISSRANFQSSLTKLLADLSNDYPSNFKSWQSYVNNYDPEKTLVELPKVTDPKERNYLVARNVFNQYYAIKSQELQLSKFTITAPFNGVVFNSNISPGVLIRAGQLIGQFINPTAFEVEIGIGLNDIDKISIGNKVRLYKNKNDSWEGRITRVSKGLDSKTQTYKAYVDVNSSSISEGMYLNAVIDGKVENTGVKIPSNLIIDNEYVFTIVDDSVLTKVPVTILHETSETTIVEGLQEGTVILNQSMTAAKDQMIVKTVK